MTNDHIPRKPVGYCSPPKEHTFKKGHKGMGGRPPKAKPNLTPTGSEELDRLILAEANRPVSVKENGKTSKMSIYEVSLRSLGTAAARGHHASRLAMIKLTQDAHEREAQRAAELVQLAEDYKTDWTRIFADCARRGVAQPDILPHPDDVQILDGDRVVFNGPIDPQSKAWWDCQTARNAQAKQDLFVTMPKITEFRRQQGYFDEPGNELCLVEDDDDPNYAAMMIPIDDLMYPSEEARRAPGFDLEKQREKARAMVPARLRKLLNARRRKRGASARYRGPPPALGPSLAEMFAELPDAKAAGLTAEFLAAPVDQDGEVGVGAGDKADDVGSSGT